MTTAAMPALAPRLHVVWCRAGDIDALGPQLCAGPIPREQPGDPSCQYLDRVIRKPWGAEEKIYEDAVSEAWLLDVEPRQRTSMHAHLRKTTILVCVDGHGCLRTGAREEIELVAGAAVLIMPGALHYSATATGMRLVEFETPKDKYDLVRLEDPAHRAGTGYETAEAALDTDADEASAPLSAVDGPPLARLRGSGAGGSVRFALRTGAELKADPDGVHIAIAVDLASVVRRRFAVMASHTIANAIDEDLHLTIHC